MNIIDLKKLTVTELVILGNSLGIQNLSQLTKQQIIYNIIKYYTQIYNKLELLGIGVLEILNDGFGFLRSIDNSYLASIDDIYVSPSHIQQFNLKTGDSILGKIRLPKIGERYFALSTILKINFIDPNISKDKILFNHLTPLHANYRLKMELINNYNNITGRILDICSPIGKGQRGLIVAPPKAGKTLLLQNIAKSITYNYPSCILIILLIDERPEEVTDMYKLMYNTGEVISSTFDKSAKRHIQVAEMVLNKAKRLVEAKKDVIILLDSITRLARAYNSITPNSGKILTGGVDATALTYPKRFFGAARNIEEGGSLTIIATALIETGSKMDEVIYEEFKGTGNMEIHLSRKIANKRIFPAIDYKKSGTRKEELLTSTTELKNLWKLRRFCYSMTEEEIINFLIKQMFKTKSNKDFFNKLKEIKL